MSGTQAHETHLLHEAPEKSPDAAKNFFHPDEVVEDLLLTRTEKREILASWASDLHAVPDAPALRQLENGAVIRLDAILTALQSLDDETSDAGPTTMMTIRHRARRSLQGHLADRCAVGQSSIQAWRWRPDIRLGG